MLNGGKGQEKHNLEEKGDKRLKFKQGRKTSFRGATTPVKHNPKTEIWWCREFQLMLEASRRSFTDPDYNKTMKRSLTRQFMGLCSGSMTIPQIKTAWPLQSTIQDNRLNYIAYSLDFCKFNIISVCTCSSIN